ncbi:MAG TPA: ABC transporter permease [Pyrinomonadaceae bacterium]|jgi:putative ABC transport system permease protein|nr:ABC transporter permease [Pyrinomonadaceae bacterium]
MKTLWQDLRFGVRVLSKSPGFTAVAILVTALGVGANTAIFSVVNAVLLRPLPFEHSEQLVQAMRLNVRKGTTSSAHSFPDFADMRAQADAFESFAAYTDADAALTGTGAPERVNGVNASADLFKVLRVNPQRGRLFAPDDEQPGGAPVVVITDGAWRRRFGADPQVVGRQVTLDGKAKTIVGVLPADFQFPFINTTPEYFAPLDPKGDMEKQRGANFLDELGRLKDGVTAAQAEAQLRAVAAGLEKQYPDDDEGRSMSLVSAQEQLVGNLRTTLLVLLGAVGFVLLVACANVANLQLARASGRGREMAIRTALGAGRWRIVRQLVTESLLLALAGGALGLVLAVWGVALISSLVPADVPRFKEAGLDPSVLAFTLAASVLTGVAFGIAPALQASRVDLGESLKEGGRGATAGRARSRVRSLLIVSEVALSVVLLVGAGLLVRSFVNLRNTNPGFDPRGVLAASVSLPELKYSKDEQLRQFYGQALERIRAVPGVESVGAIMPLPLSDNGINVTFTVEGQPDPGPGARPIAGARVVTPDYLRVMNIPVLRGRGFDEHDGASAPQVLLVNETLARQLFPGEDPIGKRLDVGLNNVKGEVVGVVRDVRSRGLEKEAGLEFYVPYEQVPFDSMQLVVRAKGGDPAALAPAVRAAVQEIDKDVPLYQVQPMGQLVADSVARQRFSMTLLAAFAGLAMVLAAVGIFSVMSFLVAQRTHEIGVRVALGAQGRDILSMVVRYGMTLALAGVAAGLVGAFALTRLMSGLLYNVSPTDPATFAVISALLLLVAFAACLVPARRATKVDPMVALRYE